MALTVNDVIKKLRYEEDDDSVVELMSAYLLSATRIVKNLTGNNFDEEDEQVQLVIVLYCEYFSTLPDDNGVIDSGFIPPKIRAALNGLYVPLVV